MRKTHMHERSPMTMVPPPDQGPPEPLTDEDIDAEVRVFEIQCLFDEVRMFGLEPPLGLKCAAALYVTGKASLKQLQLYLDRHLSNAISTMEAYDA